MLQRRPIFRSKIVTKVNIRTYKPGCVMELIYKFSTCTPNLRGPRVRHERMPQKIESL